MAVPLRVIFTAPGDGIPLFYQCKAAVFFYIIDEKPFGMAKMLIDQDAVGAGNRYFPTHKNLHKKAQGA
jgi:hypothetical protein